MESLDEKSRKKDGSDSVTTESRLSSDNSCSAQFGWPIGKTGNCLKNDVCEGKTKPHLNVESVDDKSRIKKECSKSSGQFMVFNFVNLLFFFFFFLGFCILMVDVEHEN